MFLDFFFALRKNGIPASLHEYLTLMEGLKQSVIEPSVDDFYALTRSVFVKKESHLDRFDLIFSQYFGGERAGLDAFLNAGMPNAWFRKYLENQLSEEEMARIKSLGGLDALMERFRELLEEQDEAHHGGNKWIGTGGTSPFGAGGYHPEGFRVGGAGRRRKALKVWGRRDFRNLDDRVELNTRNIKMILKRLRILTREGLPEELDLDQTIANTSRNGGMLDIAMQPSKKNRVKVLLLMDIGGSMDDHVELCEQLFSAARWQFKQLEFYYFHNCLYESVWKNNRRRFSERIPTLQLLHKFNSDYKVIFVGDAAMSPYEIYYAGGSVEHYNDEAGITWLKRVRDHFKHLAWINPLPEYEWDYFESVKIIRDFTGQRMFPMTAEGLTQAMRCLKNPQVLYANQIWGDED